MTTLPNNNPITNIASMGFKYLVDPTTIPITAAIITNGVGTTINVAFLDLKKTSTPSYVKVNDEITYTITLKNLGNTSANNVVILDTIPNDTSLVQNSVYINDTLVPNGNPSLPLSINIGAIDNGKTTTLQYKIVVNKIPSPNPIKNDSTVTFQYTVDPSIPNGKSTGNTSNSTLNTVNQATIDNIIGNGFIKTVSKKYARIADTLIYTISLKNTGNTAANNIVLIDTIPTGTSFIENSLVFNGSTLTGANLAYPGITLGTIESGSLATLSFSVKVETLPTVNPIVNNASVNFTYAVDPSLPDAVYHGGNSNSQKTIINEAIIDNGIGGGFVKYSSPYYVKIGDTITYTLVLKNSGNIQASNIILIDTVPSGTTFVTNSVLVNSITIPNGNPYNLPLAPINAGSSTTIQYKVIVNTIPAINPIPNNGLLTYKFTVDPSLPNAATSLGNCNTVYNQINSAIIDNTFGGGFIEYVDKPFGKINDILTYTLSIKNTGNVEASNIVLSSTIANESTLIKDSILVNDSIVNNLNTDGNLAIDLPKVAVSSICTVQFKVIVNTLPTTSNIKNSSSIFFNYIVNPSDTLGVIGTGNSNTVNTAISQAIIDNNIGNGFTKKANVNYAKPGDIITYTISLKNTGNVVANNILFKDTVPESSSLVPNSIILNNTPQADTIPIIKVNIPTIVPNATSTIQFKILVNSIPKLNPMENSASISFNFTVDPNLPNAINSSGNSNISKVQINQAIVDYDNGTGFVKSVNLTNATVDDVLTYTISLENTGNVTATNIVLYDTIPTGTTFVNDSVTINNAQSLGSNPGSSSGINIGNIAPNSISTVSFNVKVPSIPTVSPILNSSRIRFNYTVNPASPNSIIGYGNSNTTSTNINVATLNNNVFREFSSPYYINTKNPIEYTIRLKNSGTVDATDVTLLSTIPDRASFIPGSVKVNDNIILNATPYYPLGFNIGTIPVNSLTTVSYKILVNTIPSPSLIKHSSTVKYNYLVNPTGPRILNNSANSNFTFNQVNEAIINNNQGGLNLYVDLDNTTIESRLTYTIRVFNIGNVSASNVILRDTIPQGTIFVPNSVFINNNSVPGLNPSSPSGINLGVILPSAGLTLSFKVDIVSLPYTNPIPNSCYVTFKYLLDPSTFTSINSHGYSNTVTTQINQATIDFLYGGGFVQTLDHPFVKLKDKISYTIALKNTGNIPAYNVVLTSTIPAGTTFIENSITVNGDIIPQTNIASNSGITLTNIDPNEVVTVTFDVVVTAITSQPQIVNSASVRFEQSVDPNSTVIQSSSGYSNIIQSTLSQAIIDNEFGGFTKKASPQYVKLGEIVTYTLILKNTGNTTANNIFLKDTIPTGLIFVNNSISVNNLSITSTSIPSNGISVGSLKPGATATIQFKAIILTIPNINAMENTANCNFLFTVDPSLPNFNSETGTSNSALVTFRQAIINKDFPDSFITTISKNFYRIGEEVIYTISLKNVGNVLAENIIFKNTIPNGLSYINNSSFLNTSTINPTISNNIIQYNIGTLAVNTSLLLKFKLLVNSIPNTNPIVSTPFISFNYSKDPSKVAVQDFAISNSVSIKVNEAIINNQGFVKSVSKSFADIYDILTYNLILSNKGNVSATNVVVFDTIISGTSLVQNSILINGTTIPNSNIDYPSGLYIGTIPAGNTSLVSFNVKVNAIPSVNPIDNYATVKFNFLVEPNSSLAVESSGNSNASSTKINRAIIDSSGYFVQNIDKEYCAINEEIKYTISLTNTGNVDAIDIVLTESLPKEVSFIKDSTFIDNNPAYQYDITTSQGIYISKLSPGITSIVTFKAKVNNIPIDGNVESNCKIKFNYKVNPNLATLSQGTGLSNTTLCIINCAIIDAAKGSFENTPTPLFATTGNIITYSYYLANVGNISAYNVILTDSLPEEFEFLENSVTVQGIQMPGISPYSSIGVALNTLNVGDSVKVECKVLVSSLPTPSVIKNKAIVNFNHLVNPNLSPVDGKGESSIYSITILEAIIDNKKGSGFIKNVSSEFSTIGKTLTYNIILKNTGNTRANNVILLDTIPEYFSFVEDSVFIDGFNLPGSNPNTGINISVIPFNKEAIVSFDVLVNTLPETNPVKNEGFVDFTYTVDSSSPNAAIGFGTSNSTETSILLASIDNFQIISSPQFAKLGDVVTYTITLSNIGNAIANNILLTSTIPNGTTFVYDSLYINGENLLNPPPINTDGIQIGTINPKEETTVSFKLKVISMPTTNPLEISATINFDFILNPKDGSTHKTSGNSQICYTKINSALIDNKFKGSFDKIATPIYTKINTTIKYSLILKNVGNQSANNVVVIDTIPNGLKFIPGSITYNGISYQTANISPPTGLPIGTITPNDTVTITFEATVITTPSPNPALNSASVKFVYTVDPESSTPTIGGGNSNFIPVTVKQAIIDKNKGFSKIVDKQFLALNDIAKYTIYIKNTGNTDANNVVLTDAIPYGLAFDSESLKLNGINIPNINLASDAGINLGKLSPNIANTITFNVIVNSIPNPNVAINKAAIKYSYTIDPSIPDSEFSLAYSNEALSYINSVDFTSESGNFIVTADKLAAKLNDVLTYTIVLTNSGNIIAEKAILTNSIPEGTEFVPYSVSVNNITDISLDPSKGISLGDLSPSQVTTISFKVNSLSIPPDGLNAVEEAIVDYYYSLNPASSMLTKGQAISNKLNTPIVSADISNPTGGFDLTSDKNIVLLDDTLTYTVTISNNGNIIAYDVKFFSTIPSTAYLIPNSVTINNKPSSDTPESGINIGTLNPGATTSIAFSLVITELPENNILDADGTITYSYDETDDIPQSLTTMSIKPMSIRTVKVINLSNVLKIKVIKVKFNNAHLADEKYVDIGDIISYKIFIENISTVETENIIVQDSLPNGTSFVPNSFTINNVPILGANPILPYNIGNLDVGKAIEIGLSVSIVSVPNINTLFNTLTLKCTYSAEPVQVTIPDNNLIPNSLSSNNVLPNSLNTNSLIGQFNTVFISNEAAINTAYIGGSGFLEYVDKQFVTDNDIITYTLSINNSGTVDAQNIIITTILPNGVEFVYGSLKFNSIVYPDVDPSIGINLGSLSPNILTKISYKVKVLPNLEVSKLSKSSTINYGYIVNPTASMKKALSKSNEVISLYKKAKLKLNKSSDVTKTNLNSPISYTIIITNSGNTAADNIMITDVIESSLSFIPGTITINNVSYSSLNINDGITLTNLSPNTEVIIKYKALLSTPAPGYIIETSASASYEFTVDPNNPPLKSIVSSNVNSIVSLIYLNKTKEIPCNPLCRNSSQTTILCTNVPACCCNTLRSRIYTVENTATALECISTGVALNTYKMWVQNSIKHSILLKDPRIIKIQSISAKLEIINSIIIDTPYSAPNIEGKNLSGKLKSIYALITFTINYLNNKGQVAVKRGYKIFSTSLNINLDYLNSNLKIKGIIEDISITGFSNSSLSLSANSLIYLVPTNENEQLVLQTLPFITNGIENLKVNENISSFLLSTDILWTTVNVCSSELICSKDFLSISSTNAEIDILSTKKLLDATNYSKSSSENLKTNNRILLINILLTASVNFTANIRTQHIKIPANAYIVLPETDLPSDQYQVSTCIENLYVGTIGTTIFASANIILKASKMN